MDKKLQLEINRAKEIMNLPLLTEQGISGTFSDLLRTFFKTTDNANKTLKKLADDFDIDSKAADDLVSLWDNPNLYETLNLNEKTNIFKLISRTDGLSDNYFNQLMETFDTTLDELNDNVYDLMREGKMTNRQAIAHLFSKTPEVIPLIRRKHYAQWTDYLKKRMAADAAKGADDATKGAADAAKGAAKGADEVSGIVDDIKNTPVTDEEALEEFDEILDPDKWEEEVVGLADDLAQEAAKTSTFKAVLEYFASMFNVTKRQKEVIENLAQTLSRSDVSDDVKLANMSELDSKLRKAYKTNLKEFRALKIYLDKAAKDDKNFKFYWDKITADERTFAFWKTFGNKVKKVEPRWSRVLSGLGDNLRTMFALEEQILGGIVRAGLKKLGVKGDTLKSFMRKKMDAEGARLFTTGTRRGFPRLKNANYEELIRTKGIGAARVNYLRDLTANWARWSFYQTTFEYFRNMLADTLYTENLQKCGNFMDSANVARNKAQEEGKDTFTYNNKTYKVDDEETLYNDSPCVTLSDNWWDQFFVDWALQRRPDPNSDVIANEFLPMYFDNLIWDDSDSEDGEEMLPWWHEFWYWFTEDPGFIGETIAGFGDFVAAWSNGIDRSKSADFSESTIKATDEILKKIGVKLDEYKEKAVEVAEDMEEKLKEFTDENYNNASTINKEKYLLGYPKLKDTTGRYWEQLKRENGVWVFVRDNGDEYIMKKGKDLKNNPSEYPFVDESKRNNLEDDMWLALVDKGGNKYHPFDIGKQLNENMYSKGLSILLEQDVNPDDPRVQVGGSSGGGSGSGSGSGYGSGSGSSSSDDREEKKEEYENRMLAMFEKFNVEDRDSARNLVDKLTTRDKEAIVNDCFDALIAKHGGISKIEQKYIDDTVVSNTVIYMINDRKMDPFKILYKSPLELDAKLMESVGLESILFEQAATVSYNTIYINYLNGAANDDKFELIKGAKAERTALDNYNKRTGQSNYEETPTPSPTPRPEEQNEQRPEDAMKIDTPKMMKKHMNNEKS